MRLIGRRRPAGLEQVPREAVAVEVVERVRGPIVLRLGPDGGLLDLPGGRPVRRIISFWPDRARPGEWVEVDWPRHTRYGWFVAPSDLRLGHLIEFQPYGASSALTSWVLSVEPDRLDLVVGQDREVATLDAAAAERQWLGAFDHG